MTPSPLERLLAGSPALAESLPGLDRAAASDAPLLLVGEPGTGRTTLARALHAASRRAVGPLVEVDAAVVPTALFESELFGHVAGAFTGAGEGRAGRVAEAEGGTLLLDHVAELPVESQPKLLRLLAERRYSPLGGRERAADVRFMAVGSEDLPERVERGLFRPDLFYRLGVLAFRVPPLRERRGELEAIVGRLLGDLVRRLGLAAPGAGGAEGAASGSGEGVGEDLPAVSERAWAWMREHPWPGNLTQLRNVLERALILAPEGPLDPEPPPGAGAPPRPLAELEAAEIRRALAWTGGHQGEAAELLGISRKGLWQKRKRYGIP